uniref:Uncharacterized protein n=1 Tax=Bionectria ochroleuca TaxID=29856 RepID=A0A8H7NM36_BIOOC
MNVRYIPLENVSTPEIKVAIFAAAIESFFQSNMNCDNLTSVKRFKVVIEDSKAIGLRVVAEIAVDLLKSGANETSLGDTGGMCTAPLLLLAWQIPAGAGYVPD